MEAGKWSDEIKADVRVSVVKPLHVKCIVNFHDYVRGKPLLIKNGWEESRIMNRFNKNINLDPFA